MDSTRLADIAGRQLASGVPADKFFLLVDLADDGLLISAVDPDEGDIVDQRVLWAIHPRALDQALAEHLVRIGRVEAPGNDVWWNELRDLAGRGREKLASTDGTFVMGHGEVQFFRVAQRDLDEATAPAADQLARTLREMGKEFSAASVYLGYDNEDWPGLDKVLERDLHLPVVVSHAPADHPVRDDDEPSYLPPEFAEPASAAAAPVAATAAAASASAKPLRSSAAETKPDDAPADPEPVVPLTQRSTTTPRRRPGRLILAMAAIAAAIIAVGTATALAMSGDDDAPETPTAGLFPSTSAPSSAPTSIPTSVPAVAAPTTFADPAALAAAQVPAVRYTPPPPPVTTQDTTTGGGGGGGAQQPQNRPRPAPAPPRVRSVPNPIPGLPPIVIPRLPGGPG